jgi:hypothetical protein
MSKRLIKQIFDSLKTDEIVTEHFAIEALYNFFSKHPDWENKQGIGVDYFLRKRNEWNDSFAICRLDGTFVFISMNFTKSTNKKYEVLLALRNHVNQQIFEFKKTVNYGVDKCQLSGEILTKENSQIDHYNDDFIVVVNKFILRYDLSFEDLHEFIYKIGVKNYLNNMEIVDNFCLFHSQNTNLRCITTEMNQKRPKHYEQTK